MFTKRLKELRQRKNVLQKDVAAHLGITTSAYGFYEQGKRQPDPKTLQELANFFGVTTDYLLGRTSIKNPFIFSKNKLMRTEELNSREFGEVLKLLRNNAGLAKEKVAQEAGIKVNQLTSYEKGERLPDAETLKKLAGIYSSGNPTPFFLMEKWNQYASNPDQETFREWYRANVVFAVMRLIVNLNNLSIDEVNHCLEIIKSNLTRKDTAPEVVAEHHNSIETTIAHDGADFLPGHKTTREFDIIDIFQDRSIKLTAGGQEFSQEKRLNLLRALDNPSLLENNADKNHVPILGQIKMGIPLMAEENYAGELEIPPDIHADFALEARGDSMIGAGLLEGDYALCRKQETAYNGDIVVALEDVTSGFSQATLKYYFHSDEGPVLRAANPTFEDIPLGHNCRIAGVLVAIIRKEAPNYKVYSNYIATRDINKQMWDPVIERAFQLGIKPEQVMAILEMVYQTSKR